MNENAWDVVGAWFSMAVMIGVIGLFLSLAWKARR